MRIGILALQGAVQDHEKVLSRLGVDHSQVRLPADLEGLDGMILPGGESTVMAMYLREYKLDEALRQFAAKGGALFGLCAGAIILCSEVDGAAGRTKGALGLIDARATRNAYGRQLASFEDKIDIAIDDFSGFFPGIFIRAPRLEPLGATEIVGRRRQAGGGEAVLLRQGKILAASFHPELSGDDRLHKYFLYLAADGKPGSGSNV